MIVVIHKIELLTKKKRTKKRKVIVVIILIKIIESKSKGSVFPAKERAGCADGFVTKQTPTTP